MDQKRRMENPTEHTFKHGIGLSCLSGMLTDSRSFYPFLDIIFQTDSLQIFGQMMSANGELPWMRVLGKANYRTLAIHNPKTILTLLPSTFKS